MTNSNQRYLEETKAVTENWVIEVSSVGTIAAYHMHSFLEQNLMFEK